MPAVPCRATQLPSAPRCRSPTPPRPRQHYSGAPPGMVSQLSCSSLCVAAHLFTCCSCRDRELRLPGSARCRCCAAGAECSPACIGRKVKCVKTKAICVADTKRETKNDNCRQTKGKEKERKRDYRCVVACLMFFLLRRTLSLVTGSECTLLRSVRLVLEVLAVLLLLLVRRGHGDGRARGGGARRKRALPLRLRAADGVPEGRKKEKQRACRARVRRSDKQ